MKRVLAAAASARLCLQAVHQRECKVPRARSMWAGHGSGEWNVRTHTGLTNTLSDETIETTASASETQPVSAAVSSTCRNNRQHALQLELSPLHAPEMRPQALTVGTAMRLLTFAYIGCSGRAAIRRPRGLLRSPSESSAPRAYLQPVPLCVTFWETGGSAGATPVQHCSQRR
jgi:hypothetical protein